MEETDYLRKRLDAGLSQAATARLVGYSRQHVYRVETSQDRGSEKYKKAFLAAFRTLEAKKAGGEINSELARYPVSLTRRLLSQANTRLESMKDDLAVKNSAANKLTALLDKLSSQLELLSYTDEEDLPTSYDGLDSDGRSQFNPSMATEEGYDQVSAFICKVLIEMMMDYNFYLLSEDRINEALADWSKKASWEVRRAKYRRSE